MTLSSLLIPVAGKKNYHCQKNAILLKILHIHSNGNKVILIFHFLTNNFIEMC